MIINGYEIAFTEKELDYKLTEETIDIKLVSSKSAIYQNLSDADKETIRYLVKAAKIMNNVSLIQDHSKNLDMKYGLITAAQESTHADKALEFFNCFNGVEGSNGIDKNPIELFVGLHGFAGRNFYPEDLSVSEFHRILSAMINDGEIEEVQNILSARTMVRREGKKLLAIDYTEFFAEEFKEIANYLTKASEVATDSDFAEYLKLQAAALLENNPELDAKADKKWAELQCCGLEFTLSRENYDDAMTSTVFDNHKLSDLLASHNIEVTSKDMLGIRVGVVNKHGTELILKFKELMGSLAGLMPLSDQYHQSIADSEDVKQTMVDADLLCLEGDYAQCRGGITTAQNLPNNDKLAVKTGGGRRNVYHRQVRMTTDYDKAQKILAGLVSEDLHQYYNEERDHLFVIGHENGHSLGPNSSYQNALGKYKHVIEEHKADVVSIAFMPEYVKAKVINEKTLKEIYATWVIRRLFLVAEPKLDHPHRIADLLQFNYLHQHHAIFFDEDNKLHIDFDVFGSVMNKLLEETIVVQLSKSPKVAENFISKYGFWGEDSVRISGFIKSLGVKPYKRIISDF